MPTLLFKLRHVPDDEANDVREILDSNNIEFYETSAGNWGISTPAIWLKNSDDLEKARALVNLYQQNRGMTQREVYSKLRHSGEHKTFLKIFKENPYRFIAYITFIMFILYFSIKPFLKLAS
jgi:hypothetical protein